MYKRIHNTTGRNGVSPEASTGELEEQLKWERKEKERRRKKNGGGGGGERLSELATAIKTQDFSWTFCSFSKETQRFYVIKRHVDTAKAPISVQATSISDWMYISNDQFSLLCR